MTDNNPHHSGDNGDNFHPDSPTNFKPALSKNDSGCPGGVHISEQEECSPRDPREDLDDEEISWRMDINMKTFDIGLCPDGIVCLSKSDMKTFDLGLSSSTTTELFNSGIKTFDLGLPSEIIIQHSISIPSSLPIVHKTLSSNFNTDPNIVTILDKVYGYNYTYNKLQYSLELFRGNIRRNIDFCRLFFDAHRVILEPSIESYDSTDTYTRFSGHCKTRECKNLFHKDLKNLMKHKLFCCMKCTHKIIKEKSKQVYFDRTGFYTPASNPAVKEKIKKTNLERTNYSNPFQNPEIRERIKQTNLIKRNCEYPTQDPLVREKSKKTIYEKTGYTHHMKDPKFRERIRQEYFNKTGFYHSSQNPEVRMKQIDSSFQTKNYTMPSGKIIKYRGYENFAFDVLFHKYNIDEDDILTDTSGASTINYFSKDDDKNRVYFPDIYIKSKNLYIEVKCEASFTFKRSFAKNLSILEHMFKNGYNYQIWFFDKKGEFVKCISDLEGAKEYFDRLELMKSETQNMKVQDLAEQMKIFNIN